jgi:hypothetical protein
MKISQWIPKTFWNSVKTMKGLPSDVFTSEGVWFARSLNQR